MPKKGQKMSPEQKAALQKGRKEAAARKKIEKEEKRIKQDNSKYPSIITDPNAKLTDDHETPTPVNRVQPVPEGVELPDSKVTPDTTPEPAPSLQETDSIAMMQKMQAQIEALTAQVNNQTPMQKLDAAVSAQQPQIGQGGVHGQVFKYPVEQGHYPDPTDRLYDDPKLRRFALRENFYFKWEVTGVTYEKYNITYTEPRFMVELWRFIFDEETGEPTGEMFLVNRQIQHEDEMAARIAADKLGYKIGEGERFANLQEMMDEMRFWRIRQWLIAVFTPFKASQHKNRKTKQKVIGGRVVEVTDSEVLVDAGTGMDTADTVNREIQLTPAQQREAAKAGLL